MEPKNRRLTNRLSVKLIFAFFTASLALTAALWFSLDISFERQFSDNIRPYFSKYLINLQKKVGSPPDIKIAKGITEKYPVDIVVEAPNFSWSSNGDFIDKPYLDVKLQQIGDKGIISEAGFYKGNFILRTFHGEYTTSFIITEKLNKLPRWHETVIIICIVLCILGVLFGFIRYLFAPIHTIELGVQRIGNGEVTHRLAAHRKDEWGTLAETINKMADNIEQMLEAKRQLLLAISHELRTPITRSKIALSLLDESQDKESIVEDLQEMESLIQELLESERLRENHAPLELSHVDINEIIYQVHGRFFENSPLVLELADKLPKTDLDASRIGLAIKNIIKNALTASEKDQQVIVTSQQRDDDIVISIKDSGMGIKKELIPYLTEPFYRTDRSRQRSTGGTGIGLYLIKAIIDAHNGQLTIDSEVDKGTTVTIQLPVTNKLSEDDSDNL